MPTPEQNLTGVFLADGWWFPGGCLNGRHAKYLAHENDVIPAIRRLPKDRRRTCVQAGANVGLFPVVIARYFQQVVTFEPEVANWTCLQRNLEARPERAAKIATYRAALGEKPGTGALLHNEKNPAGHKFRFAGESAADDNVKYTPIADTTVMAIDQLALSDVDAIFLDIEGAEWPALRGAVKTIEQCRPIILIEEREHMAVHGYTPEDLHKWLRSLGYRHAGKVAKDQLWMPS